MKKILVLGGGFAGVEAAIKSAKKNFSVTLVSDRDYLYVYPLAIWVPTGEKEFKDICIPLKDIQKKWKFQLVVDTVKQIKPAENKVVLENSRLDYDYLIVAVGAHKVKQPGSEHTLSVCGPPEMSVRIREKLAEIIARGSGTIAMGFGGNPKDKSAVRGGPEFELIFNVHHYLRKKKIRDNFELVFFAPMKRPGERMGGRSVEMVNKMFDSLGIKKEFGKKITAFEQDGVRFEDDSKLEADVVMYIPAGRGHDVLKGSGLPLSEAGFVKIDDTCKVPGFDNVYAVGDVAALEGPDWVAKQGHVAEVMAHAAAYNIAETEKGSSKRKGYKHHLSILCIMDTGNGAAVVYRGHKRAFMLPMPLLGHWFKKGWGVYNRLTKLGKMPHFPGF